MLDLGLNIQSLLALLGVFLIIGILFSLFMFWLGLKFGHAFRFPWYYQLGLCVFIDFIDFMSPSIIVDFVVDTFMVGVVTAIVGPFGILYIFEVFTPVIGKFIPTATIICVIYLLFGRYLIK